ncbi:MAG: DUF305 domain-containing protein [Phyllobacterium sp.]|uniref:DUF305 domain-containing protein n=1 Tax=Phyllobacterium sp. TaxID=1871046 RepID=UPI0030F056FE
MTSFYRSSRIFIAPWVLALLSVSAFAHDSASHQHAAVAVSDETPFLNENDAAMTKMMNDMAVKPTGDVNRDFVEMMIPHHQGAIDMAIAYLRYGNNDQLKRLAQEIIVEQQQEIVAMRMALGDPLPTSAAVPTQIEQQAITPIHSSSDEDISSEAPATQMMMRPAN